MKRILILLLVIITVLSCSACNSNIKTKTLCWSCNKEYDSVVSFCAYCGTSLNSTSTISLEDETISNLSTSNHSNSISGTSNPTSTPSSNTNLYQLKTLVNKISGRWFLEGYSDVYIDVRYEPNNSISTAYMFISSHSFSMKDNGVSVDGKPVHNDYTVYPHIKCPEGTQWTTGNMYWLNSWDSDLAEHNIKIKDDCIYMDTYKFVRTKGIKNQHSEYGILDDGMEHDYESKIIEATPTTYGYTLYTCKVCSFSYEDNYFNWDGPPVTDSSTIEQTPSMPQNEKPISSETPTYTDVLIISDTRTISNETINTNVYITSIGNATFNNVTVNGNVYCYGQLTVSGGGANNLYAYYWNLGGITSSCDAWDGTHGLVKGAFKTCGDVVIKDDALNYAFDKWGEK